MAKSVVVAIAGAYFVLTLSYEFTAQPRTSAFRAGDQVVIIDVRCRCGLMRLCVCVYV